MRLFERAEDLLLDAEPVTLASPACLSHFVLVPRAEEPPAQGEEAKPPPTGKAHEIEIRARALAAMIDGEVPFLVAGKYAQFAYTGIYRETKDLDLFLLERDLPAAFRVLEKAGFRTEIQDARWIGKAYFGDSFVDLIFASSNGLCVVDDLWFQHAREGAVLGYQVPLAPPEEMIFSKAFVDERERFDGADINHLIYACGHEMDWERLLARFGPHWELLFAHLSMYRFVYPGARRQVPDWVMDELCRRTQAVSRAGDAASEVCRGHLISNEQYRQDYELRGMASVDALPLCLSPGWGSNVAPPRPKALGTGSA
ncbi:hypothetical protein [Chondromyces apiculatus]|uniref:Nucleotidyltransferase family protein n=1 Tax=Chondromyces apiculatus DSM 436 TaxID=1192034 RepID=A0A017SVF8_9BACT|nr:hypothetical protein [Chondromyces apiculatus]EYF00954.1 Hypothetical protein CAP_8822 [Chondromyces apiculatus DSM 436]